MRFLTAYVSRQEKNIFADSLYIADRRIICDSLHFTYKGFGDGEYDEDAYSIYSTHTHEWLYSFFPWRLTSRVGDYLVKYIIRGTLYAIPIVRKQWIFDI